MQRTADTKLCCTVVNLEERQLGAPSLSTAVTDRLTDNVQRWHLDLPAEQGAAGGGCEEERKKNTGVGKLADCLLGDIIHQVLNIKCPSWKNSCITMETLSFQSELPSPLKQEVPAVQSVEYEEARRRKQELLENKKKKTMHRCFVNEWKNNIMSCSGLSCKKKKFSRNFDCTPRDFGKSFREMVCSVGSL